jgi:hypothetical protein
VKGTWKEGSLAGDPEAYIEKALETGIYFNSGPNGKPGRGLIYQEVLEMDEGGSSNGASISLSEEAQCRWP